ncbi:hypothetical protein F444_10789 [Phytophthora nicotianae P1976]|uniref:RxLR effector protein n=2 Tax=Phytophthora nicotianae TaxID=4792 RepID=A0A081A2Z1_PHYNI|nr:hypothetical protein F444_10789 [Phytophthora nicotianae P1976]
MLQNLVILTVVFLVASIERCDAVSSVAGADQIKCSKHATLSTPFGPALVTKSKDKQHLRVNDKATGQDDAEARDITLGSVISASAKAMRMKAKLNMMLLRGLKPDRVLKKLKVVRMTDKNFNNFARFYAQYRAKYASKKPDLPTSAEDVILLPKLKGWLGQRLLPSQVKFNLKELASTNVNKYLQLYLKDADNIVILPMLERWKGQKILPSQFKNNLNEIGVTDTTRYMEWYMRNGGDDIVMAKLRKWVSEDVPMENIVTKLEKIGVLDTTKYVDWYRESIIMAKLRKWLSEDVPVENVISKLEKIGVTDTTKFVEWYMRNGRDAPVIVKLQKWVNQGLYPPQIVAKLQQTGTTGLQRYFKVIGNMYGKRQAELSRRRGN